jgi:hypothetical protein
MGKLGFGLCVVAAPAVSRRSPAFTNANSEYRHAAPEAPAPAVPADGMAVTQQADAEASMLSMDQIQAFLDHANEQMAMLVPVLVRRVAGEIEAFEKSDGALSPDHRKQVMEHRYQELLSKVQDSCHRNFGVTPEHFAESLAALATASLDNEVLQHLNKAMMTQEQYHTAALNFSEDMSVAALPALPPVEAVLKVISDTSDGMVEATRSCAEGADLLLPEADLAAAIELCISTRMALLSARINEECGLDGAVLERAFEAYASEPGFQQVIVKVTEAQQRQQEQLDQLFAQAASK